ncbi:MAG: phosphatidylserine decarboxylase [Acidobacteria bacterium]|jgi:phosphatidylserine decarboxylase|nr:phosphatidylserine decarboxylase [Acidobacteriota bacterium]
MAREGLPYILVPLLLAIILFAIGYWPFALPLVVLAGFMAYFFRDPQRTAPTEDGVIVSPADGRVTRVRPLIPGEASSSVVISIFLSPLDVHINRSPIAGTISDVTYTQGKFLMATKEDSSLVNEQNALTIQGKELTVVCKQIAGVLARRIICWKRAGDEVALGERIGLIKFSSRTDLILPPNVQIEVSEGMRVRGGATVIGRIVQ